MITYSLDPEQITAITAAQQAILDDQQAILDD